MGNDPILVIFAVLFPILLVGELVLLVLLWRTGGGRLPRVATPRAEAPAEGKVAHEVWLLTVWLVTTALSMGMGFVATFVAVHVLLFTLGTQAAMVGLLVSALFLGAIPLVVAWFVHRRAQAR